MSHDPELARFGLDDDTWITRLRDAQAPAELGDLGPYRLIREVARGGQAIVYEAIRQTDGARVALKRLIAGRFANAVMLQRFEREVEAVSLLSHPNIVRFAGMEMHEGQPVVVMEWIEGVRITDWSRGRDRGEVLVVLRRIAEAIAHAHRSGVIHRDLKPENILVAEDGEPHVLDFGIAKWSEIAKPAEPSLTLTNQFLGTPAYCSPEQVGEDPRRIDARTDVYSLGVIAYHLLVGRLPFDLPAGLRRVLETIATAEPRRPRDVAPGFDRDLEAILLKMLAKDPDRRYASMDLFLADLGRLERGDPVEAEGQSRRMLLRKFFHRNRLPLAILSGFVALIAAFGITMAILYKRAETEATRLEQVESFLTSMITPEGTPPSGAPAFTVADILDRASARLEGGTVEDPEVRGRLHLRLARNHGSIWNWSQAAEHARAALEVFRETGDRSRIAQALAQLGLAEAFLENPRAVGHSEEAVAILREREGPRSPDYAAALGVLAFASYRAADPPDPERAEACYAEALEILESEPESGPLLAGTYYSYAVLAVERDDPRAAETRYRRALAIYTELPRTLSIIGARCMEDYAKTLAALGRVEEARSWLHRSREDRPLDPAVCETPAVIGEILRRNGNDEAAIPFFFESQALTCTYLTSVRPEHAKTLGGFTEALEQGRLEPGFLLEIGATCRRIDPDLHASWLRSLRSLEEIYERTDPERAAICRSVLRKSGTGTGS
ncbi:MAG: protein kinase [Candidatus Eisenbacteria bacterium]|nr:protein kinase [Candidatus Latescibacterota bacterium]MBD3302997.1 protein kinase [Candidatus Eisenbacteria bacterium]